MNLSYIMKDEYKTNDRIMKPLDHFNLNKELKIK